MDVVMTDRERFEAEFPSRNVWLGNRYDHPIDQARWEVWQALRAARAWQPISEAPKDGTRVLIYVPPYGAMTGSNDFHLFGGQMQDRWHCHSCLNKEAQPTHWQPLPEPPEAES